MDRLIKSVFFENLQKKVLNAEEYYFITVRNYVGLDNDLEVEVAFRSLVIVTNYTQDERD